jgi:hypothetical protein
MKKLLLLSLFFILSNCSCNHKITLSGVTLEIPSSISGLASKENQEKLSELIKRDINDSLYFHVDTAKIDADLLKLLFIPTDNNKENTLLLVGILQEGEKEYRALSDIKIIENQGTAKALSDAIEKVLFSLYELKSDHKLNNKDYLAKINTQASAIELLTAIYSVNQDPKAIEPLIKLLSKTTDIAVGNAAVLVLANMQAKEAMPAIIDFMERKPPIVRRQGIMAARKIGSQLALEWLLVMAYGHDDAEVRKEALEAFNELLKKQK